MNDIDWLELVVGFSCNCRCIVCPSAYLGHSETMAKEQLSRELALGRRRGATGVWFGGGEPTLHPGLVSAAAEARSLGYQRIRVQTNGMRLSYPDYTGALADAGVTEIALSVMGAPAEVHDAITRTQRSFELMLAGAANARQAGMRLEADVLMSTRSLGHLDQVVITCADAGVESFTFWLTSLHGLDRDQLAEWAPSLSQAVPAMTRAIDLARERGARATSLHTPPCVLPAEYRDAYVHAGTWRLLVVVPGGEPFMAETSPMEGGTYVEGCTRCDLRAECLGARQDYIDSFGSAELVPITRD